MSDLRLNNSIFLMYLATEEYKREHNITSLQFLDLDKKYGMTKPEMASEIDEYIAANQ